MDVIEPLWATITTVHDLIKAHKDLSSELIELGETVKLISIAMKPLLDTISKKMQDKQESSPGKELEEVLGALKSVLDESEKTLKKIQDEDKKGFFAKLNPFRSQNHVEEIKSHQEKLKTLTPILTLAINSLQHKSDSSNRNFSAGKLLKNEDAKGFWVYHFGDQEYKVTWSRFWSAFKHQFSENLKNSNIDVNRHTREIKKILDKNGDDEVDIYEFVAFTNEKSPCDSFLDLIKPIEHNAPSENSDKNRKRKSPESSANTDDSDHSVPSNKRVDTKKNVADSSNIEASPKPPSIIVTDINDNTVVLQNEITESKPGYTLNMTGHNSVISSREVKNIFTIKKNFHDEPASFGRVFFEKLPEELLLRISRQHFQIQCHKNQSTNEFEYSLLDQSVNGTYINGKMVGRNKKVTLKDGDRIGILMVKPELIEVEFGYIFKTND